MSDALNLFVVGEPGAGARSFVRRRVASALAVVEPVLILDCGRNYEHFCRLMGGTVLELHLAASGKGTTILKTFDAKYVAPLQVCDFEGVVGAWSTPLPARDEPFWRSDSLLVVDDLLTIRERYPAVEAHIAAHLAGGGRCCVVGATEDDFASIREMCAPSVLKKFSPSSSNQAYQYVKGSK